LEPPSRCRRSKKLRRESIGVLVSGRGSNLEAVLRSVESGYIRNAGVSVVVSNIADARALQIAKKHHVPTEVIESKSFQGSRSDYDGVLVERLEKHGLKGTEGLVILAGFMRILSPEFVRRFSNRLINVHPSLLPAFPGLHAQRQALEYGAKVSGCTVHFVVPEVDAGAIILQKAVRVEDDDDEESLSHRILLQEHRLLPEAVKLFVEGRLRVTGRRVAISN
jgi:phosphoribosylglycinamide formyltransferase 1